MRNVFRNAWGLRRDLLWLAGKALRRGRLLRWLRRDLLQILDDDYPPEGV